MNSVLIIVPDGGMLFESVGVTDILMQANERNACSGLAQAPYQVTIATTQMHKAVHGRSGLTLLADARLTELDPREKRGTIMVTGVVWMQRKMMQLPAGYAWRLRIHNVSSLCVVARYYWRWRVC